MIPYISGILKLIKYNGNRIHNILKKKNIFLLFAREQNEAMQKECLFAIFLCFFVKNFLISVFLPRRKKNRQPFF